LGRPAASSSSTSSSRAVSGSTRPATMVPPRRERAGMGTPDRAKAPTSRSRKGRGTWVAAARPDAWVEDADRVGRAVAEAPAGSVLVADLEIPPVLVTAAVRAARRGRAPRRARPGPGRPRARGPPSPGRPRHPDHREAQTLTGIDASEPDGARRAAEQLRERGVGAAHVKVASGGSAVAFQDGTVMVAGPADPAVVDATGGGNAYAGALAWALWSGRSPREAAPLAVAASACAIGTYAPRSPTRPRGAGGDARPGGPGQPAAGSRHRPRWMTSQLGPTRGERPTVAGRLPLVRGGPQLPAPDLTRRREPWQGR
jgi:pfkB family carbohydrate kinase